jgi:hypothetical protein
VDGEEYRYAAASVHGFRVERWRVPAVNKTNGLQPPAAAARATLTCRSEEELAISVELHVEFQPEFTISRTPGFGVPIVEGQSVRLRCSVEASPPASAFWEHNGSRLPSVSAGPTSVAEPEADPSVAELFFPVIRQDSEGWYQCSAQHKFGNFSSVGYYLAVKPRRTATIDTDGSSSGAEPAGGWSTGGGQRTTSAQLSDKVFLVETVGPVPAGRAASGCDGGSTNNSEVEDEEGGKNSFAAELPTVNLDRTTVIAAEGENVRLEVELCSGRPVERAIWSGPEQLLLSAGQSGPRWAAQPIRHSARTECQLAELVLTEVTADLAGLYLLIVVSGNEQVAVGRRTLLVAANPSLSSGTLSRETFPFILIILLFIQCLKSPI